MKARLNADILDIGDVEYNHRKTCSGARLSHLAARIARRPGKWRRRMQRRVHHEDDAPFYPEAA